MSNMQEQPKVLVVETVPGITTDADNPLLSGNNFTYGNRIRFDGKNGLPQKMLGFTSIGGELIDASTAIFLDEINGLQVALIAQPSIEENSIEFLQFTFDINRNIIFKPNGEYITKFVFSEEDQKDLKYNEVTPQINLITKIEPETQEAISYYLISFSNRISLTSTKEYFLYYAKVQNDPALDSIELTKIVPLPDDNKQLKEVKTDGGVIVLNGELIVKYGKDGVIYWNNISSAIDAFRDWKISNSVTISSNKIYVAKQVRSASIYSMLSWAGSDLILSSYNSTNVTEESAVTLFESSTITTETSIISANSIVQCNNIYFWVGKDQFYIYSGQMTVLQNKTNRDFFFNDLDFRYRNLIVGQYNSRKQEIFWFYTPKNNNGKINTKIIAYSLLYNEWYITDAVLPTYASFVDSNYFDPIISTGGTTIRINNQDQVISPYIFAQEHEIDLRIMNDPEKNQSQTTKLLIPLEAEFKSQWIDLLPNDSFTIYIQAIEPNFIINQTNENIQKYTMLLYTKNYGTDEPKIIEKVFTKNTSFVSFNVSCKYFAIGIKIEGLESYFYGWNPRVIYQIRNLRRTEQPK